MKFYHLLTVNDNEDLHLVKQDQYIMKDQRRRMVLTSVHNLASYIAAVGYSNFCPITEIWNYPKGISKGSLLLLRILRSYRQLGLKFCTPIRLTCTTGVQFVR